MYHAHFGLERALFGDGIATDAAVFRSPKHEALAANFKLALGSPSSGVVLRGPAGVGKSTLTSSVLRASSTRLALAWINATPANAAELLELVLVELGVNTVGTTRIERLQLWRQFQGEMRATESRLFVVVERTEDLPTDVLHALDSLTAADAIGNLGANFVLLGHGHIEQHLAAPVLESLRQRIRLRAELTPFTEAELQDYLRHQVACAGGHFDHVFAPGAVAALHRLSGGVARLANTLCETALDLAASQQQKLLTPELVTKTAQSVLGLAQAAPASSASATPLRAPDIAIAVPTAAPLAAWTVAPPVAKAPAVAAPIVAPVPAPVVAAASVAAPAPVISPAPIAPPAQATVPAPVPAAPPAPAAAAPTPAATPVVAVAPVAPAAVIAPAPVAPAPVATAPALVAPIAITAPPANVAAAPKAPAAPVVAAPPEPQPDYEFDGSATDISDVAMADFPVLTDAVEEFPPIILTKRVTAPAQPTPAPAAPSAPAAKPAVATRAPAPPPAAKPTTPAPTSRVETAYAAPKNAAPKPAPAVPPAAPAVKPAASAAAPRLPAIDSDDDDLLRQTQTMRAISAAKSIDDISSSMAETLFGDAELDLMTAALASAAADLEEDERELAKAAARPAAPSKPEPRTTALAADDPFDFLGLGNDAPLELIDDSTLPPASQGRKSAAR